MNGLLLGFSSEYIDAGLDRGYYREEYRVGHSLGAFKRLSRVGCSRLGWIERMDKVVLDKNTGDKLPMRNRVKITAWDDVD
jgi:hypothetical protein